MKRGHLIVRRLFLSRKHGYLAVIHLFRPVAARKDELINFIHLFRMPDTQNHEYFSVIHGFSSSLIRKPINPLFGFPCQPCSESCAFQAVAAVIDCVYELKPYRKKQRRGKYLLDSPSESSWSVEKSGRQHRKNGLRVDALTGSFLQARPDAPVRQAAVSEAMNPSVLIEMAVVRLS